jgi:hypothetical protein
MTSGPRLRSPCPSAARELWGAILEPWSAHRFTPPGFMDKRTASVLFLVALPVLPVLVAVAGLTLIAAVGWPSSIVNPSPQRSGQQRDVAVGGAGFAMFTPERNRYVRSLAQQRAFHMRSRFNPDATRTERAIAVWRYR